MVRKRVQLGEVLYEIKRYGNYLRVAALDPVSGIETYTTGPLSMGEAFLKKNARRKLEYIVSKKLEERLSRR